MSDRDRLEILGNLYDRAYDYGVKDTLDQLAEVFGEEEIKMTDVWKEANK